jgi:hypothetical protein
MTVPGLIRIAPRRGKEDPIPMSTPAQIADIPISLAGTFVGNDDQTGTSDIKIPSFPLFFNSLYRIDKTQSPASPAGMRLQRPGIDCLYRPAVDLFNYSRTPA